MVSCVLHPEWAETGTLRRVVAAQVVVDRASVRAGGCRGPPDVGASDEWLSAPVDHHSSPRRIAAPAVSLSPSFTRLYPRRRLCTHCTAVHGARGRAGRHVDDCYHRVNLPAANQLLATVPSTLLLRQFYPQHAPTHHIRSSLSAHPSPRPPEYMSSAPACNASPPSAAP